MSKSDSSDLNSRNHSETTIVQCPGCSTRFAVDSTVIAQLDFPRFHCSRCDHVFALTESGGTNRAVPAPEPEVLPVVTAKEDETGYDLEAEHPPFEAAEPELREQQETDRDDTGEYKIPYRNGSTEEISASHSAPKTTRIEEHASLEIPSLLHRSRIDTTPPHESIPTAKLSAPTVQSSRSAAPENSQLEMPLNISPAPKPPLPAYSETVTKSEPKISRPKSEWELGIDVGSSSAEFSGMASSNYTAEFLTKNYREEDRTITPPEIMRDTGVVLPASGVPQGWYALAIIVAPILIFLGLVGGLSLYVTSSSSGAQGLTAALLPSMPQVPPAELQLKEPRFKRVTLENGDNVYVVSGAVFNRSEKSLRDITLEGVAFDGRGQPIFSTRVNLGATLSKARLRSLSPETIQKLQYGQINKSSDLSPGDEQDFAFAMLPESSGELQPATLSNAQYFGARIYSVHN